MKIIKLEIDEDNEFEGIDAVALVEDPAIEMDFLMFSKQESQLEKNNEEIIRDYFNHIKREFNTNDLYYKVVQDILDDKVSTVKEGFAAINADQQILAGPLMIADKLIPRVDDEGEKYYVFFDAAGIKKLSYKLMQNKLIDSINIEHNSDQQVSDMSLVETWLVEDPEKDKSATYGYNLPKGSWFGVYKVNNKQVWDDYIKTKKVLGFSIEGIFRDKIIMQNAVTK
tara:strand:+ start:1816 stop:2493 length:678 start_codon:yes stop_codon:yes gene_type:complete